MSRRVLSAQGRRRCGPAHGLESFEGINITPFTDVLLVLLIIFMIAGSALAPTGIGLSGLATEGAPRAVEDADKPALQVEIDADGVTRLRYQDELLGWDEVAKLPRSTLVTLQIEPSTRAERIVGQYERLLDLGFHDIEWAPPRAK